MAATARTQHMARLATAQKKPAAILPIPIPTPADTKESSNVASTSPQTLSPSPTEVARPISQTST